MGKTHGYNPDFSPVSVHVKLECILVIHLSIYLSTHNYARHSEEFEKKKTLQILEKPDMNSESIEPKQASKQAKYRP